MSKTNEEKDLISMNRMDALWQYGTATTIKQMKSIIKRRYESAIARKWCLWLIGESGIGKNYLQEQVTEDLCIEYLWFPCKGIAPEDIRGFPMPVRKLNGECEKGRYSGDMQGLVDLTYDYYHQEPTYTFQLIKYIEKAFDPNWKGIIHFDEFAQAAKEVQEILYMFFYDRRLDDRYLSDGALIIASMNPPSENEYMLAKISKAAQDRPSLFKIEPSVSEWIEWARNNTIYAPLVDFVSEHHSVYERNKGRALHRFSDILKTFGTIDPLELPPELKLEAYANIDITSADMFAKYLKEIYAISGVSLLMGEKKQFDKLKKMLKSEAKSVLLYRIQREMLKTLEEPEVYLKALWTQHADDSGKAWDSVSERVIMYLKLLQNTDMDSAIGFLKEITKMSIINLEDRLNVLFRKTENRDLYKEVQRCLHIPVNNQPEEDPANKTMSLPA